MVFRTDRISRNFTHKANVTKNIPHNVTIVQKSKDTAFKMPKEKITHYKPVGARGTVYTPKPDVPPLQDAPMNGPFEGTNYHVGDKNYTDQTVTDLPLNLKQSINDDRLISNPSWTDKLFNSIPSVQFPEAHAEHIDTQGNADKQTENDKLKINPDRDPAVWYNPLSWFGNVDMGDPTVYKANEVAGDPPPASDQDYEGAPSKELQPLDLSSTDKGYTNHLWLGKLQGQGTGLGTTPNPGSTEFEIMDYVGRTTSTSNYNLPSNVSVSAHQDALNRQQIAKFENNIQSQYVTMLRGAGGPNAEDYSNLQTQIKKSNLSDRKKDALLDQYAIKSQNYSNVMTGNASNYQNRKLTVAEKLQAKRDSGEGLTAREQKKLDTLTGKFSKAPSSNDNFDQYAFDVMKSNYLDANPGATGLPKHSGDIMGWDDIASSSYKKGTVNKPYSTKNAMDHYDYFA